MAAGHRHQPLDHARRRFGDDDLLDGAGDRQVEADHGADDRAPGAGAVDDLAGADFALAGLHAPDRAVAGDGADLGAFEHAGAVGLGEAAQGHGAAQRVDAALAGAVDGAGHAVGEVGGEAAEFVGADDLAVHAVAVFDGDLAAQPFETFGAVGEHQAAGGGDAEAFAGIGGDFFP